jgi:hypothetical protein
LNDFTKKSVAEIIVGLDLIFQEPFLLYILNHKIERDEAVVRKAKKRFQNNTICTIGYEGTEINKEISTASFYSKMRREICA